MIFCDGGNAHCHIFSTQPVVLRERLISIGLAIAYAPHLKRPYRGFRRSIFAALKEQGARTPRNGAHA